MAAMLGDIAPELDKCQREGKSLGLVFDKLSQYLKTFDVLMKVVFIVDEIGLAKKKGVKLSEIFNHFRTKIESNNVVIILAGIPYNFHELTSEMDVKTDSGFMSYVGESIVLGPLTDDECKNLIKNNLSKRIQISDDVLNFALQLSARRPEDLQIIMHFALKAASDNTQELHEQTLIITHQHIEKGFAILLERRGYTCSKIWEKISEKGKTYLKTKLKTDDENLQELLDTTFNDLDVENISTVDIEIFKGYGFTNLDEKLLIIPVYFQEWVRLEFYKRQFEKEDEKYED